jgi:GDPmannose 4,6-dehydratase
VVATNSADLRGRTALITGITGQDGSYLAEYLQSLGYIVHGVYRSPDRTQMVCQHAHVADLCDIDVIRQLVCISQPDECYHLAAQTQVVAAPTQVASHERSTLHVNLDGTLHLLQALAEHRPMCRVFVAGSSEMFGDADVSPQNENTPFRPRNVYGVSKVSAYHLMRLYRNRGLFACCGILYNHESPRRPEHFISRKITRAVARIKAGVAAEVTLGNLDSVRDWGDARDFVEAMWLMLQQPAPDDYVIATGRGSTVRDLLDIAFGMADLDWRGYVRIDAALVRPVERFPLIGSADKARSILGWRPRRDLVGTIRDILIADFQDFGLQAPTLDGAVT